MKTINQNSYSVGLLLIFFFPLIQSSCKKQNNDLPIINSNSYVWPTISWAKQYFSETEIDSTLIYSLHEEIQDGNYGDIHSLLIVKDGYLIFEEYYNGHNSTEAHELQSATKSIASILAGIAIDKNYFSENDFVTELLDTVYYNDGNVLRNSIRVKDILTMKHGMEWHEWGYETLEQDNYIMANSADWIQYLLDRPMLYQPDSTFTYSTGASVFISAMINHSTGKLTEDFASKYLFTPIGITSQDWWVKDTKGIAHTGGALKLNAQDMARFGFLILKDGIWNEDTIISKQFLDKAFISYTENVFLLSLNNEYQAMHYGYHWWIMPIEYNGITYNVRVAWGTGSQCIFIIKELDIVIVTTAWNIDEPEATAPHSWIKKYFLQSCGQ